MHDERISPAVSRVETAHDRSEDTPHYQALEDARNGSRRHSRRRDSDTVPSSRRSAAGNQLTHATPDGIRGTKLDVVG